MSVDDLMCGYQKSSMDSRMMPGLGDYLDQIKAQNEQIILLLKSMDSFLKDL